MPLPPASRPNDLDFPMLDSEALRHLVTRPELARLFWNRKARLATESVLISLYGDRAEKYIELVSQQALATFLGSIISVFRTVQRRTASPTDDAKHVLETVRLIAGFELPPIAYNSRLQHTLLHAALLAALKLLLYSRSPVKDLYRSLVDSVRSAFPSPDRYVRTLRSYGISTIKHVASALYSAAQNRAEGKANRAEAVRYATKFRRRHPEEDLVAGLEQQLAVVNNGLPDLWMHAKHAERRGGLKHAVKGMADVIETGSERVSLESREPYFFSDPEEGSEIHEDEEEMEVEEDGVDLSTLDHGSPQADPDYDTGELNYASRRGGSSVDDDSSQELRSRKKRRSRISLRNSGEQRRSSRNERPRSAGDSSARGRKLRPRNSNRRSYREDSERSESSEDSKLSKELDRMDPKIFEGGEDETQSECLSHVARHAQTNPSNPRKRRRHEDVPGEGASKEGLDNPPMSCAEGNDSGDDADEGQGDAERAELKGPNGETIRKLHELSAKLDQTNMPDPLPSALEDASRAVRRSRRSATRRYEPRESARVASPIPDSEPPMQRQKRIRAVLERGSPGEESDEQALRIGTKVARSGRYQPYEDELLIAGLRKYGWGMWTAISQNFGEGRYTRAPMSLKDRARTLELDHQKYPLPPSVKKRGRPTEAANLLKDRRASPEPCEESGEEVESSLPADDDEETKGGES